MANYANISFAIALFYLDLSDIGKYRQQKENIILALLGIYVPEK